MKGKLIIIDGTDGVGKETQTTLLQEALATHPFLKGKPVRKWHFPDYQSVWGKLLRQYLDGDSPFHFNPGYASLLFAADRSLIAQEMQTTLDLGGWIVCDRYTSSNTAFQGSLFSTIQERDQFDSWLQWLEQDHLQLPKPDLTILLTLPTTVSKERLAERKNQAVSAGMNLNDKVGKNDIHEEDGDFMERVAEEYRRLASVHGWPVIECFDPEQHTQLSRAAVHEKVMNVVSDCFFVKK